MTTPPDAAALADALRRICEETRYVENPYAKIAFRIADAALRAKPASEVVEQLLGRPFMVNDPVVRRDRPDWNLGVVQSVSDEESTITCAWWADHGFFQAGVHPRNLRHAAEVHRELRTRPATTESDGVRVRDIVLRELKRGRRAGESQEMIARWITTALAQTPAIEAAALERAATIEAMLWSNLDLVNHRPAAVKELAHRIAALGAAK